MCSIHPSFDGPYRPHWGTPALFRSLLLFKGGHSFPSHFRHREEFGIFYLSSGSKPPATIPPTKAQACHLLSLSQSSANCRVITRCVKEMTAPPSLLFFSSTCGPPSSEHHRDRPMQGPDAETPSFPCCRLFCFNHSSALVDVHVATAG